MCSWCRWSCAALQKTQHAQKLPLEMPMLPRRRASHGFTYATLYRQPAFTSPPEQAAKGSDHDATLNNPSPGL
jgi:hypothetical protein